MPEATPSPATADRNPLFGILALQRDFISQDDLVRGMNAWSSPPMTRRQKSGTRPFIE